jgi:hypothetical protein
MILSLVVNLINVLIVKGIISIGTHSCAYKLANNSMLVRLNVIDFSG